MTHQIAHPKAETLDLNWLYKVSAASALMAAGFLIAGAILLVLTVFRPVITDRWITALQNNWLVILFKLHAGLGDVQLSLLDHFNLLDIAILCLSAIMYVGLYTALRKTSRIWAMIALAQLILGMVLFIVTKTAGRSSLMGAELVISMVMLESKLFDKRIAFAGALSALLLLAGDLGASMAPSPTLAIAMGTGYMLLVIWLILVGRRLLQPGQYNELE